MQKPDKPFDNKRIFWDIDSEKLDYEAKSSFIIERVFERGDVEDIRMCRRYYGDERIEDALLKAKFLPERRLHLASAIINKPLNSFLCYTMRQSKTALLPY